MQELVLRAPTQASALREEHVEGTEETVRNKQKAREKTSEGLRRVDEGKTAKSIWDMLGNDQKKVVRTWHSVHLTSTYSRTKMSGGGLVLRPLSWQSLRTGIREIEKVLCEGVVRPLFLAPAPLDEH